MRTQKVSCTALVALALAVYPAAGPAQTARPHSSPPTAPATAPAKSAAAPAKQAAAGKSKPVPKMTDQQLESVIRAKFATSKSAPQFKVHVQGGVATIDGKTDVVQHKGAATRMAKKAGAVAVNNKVEVSDAAKKKAAGNLEEGRRRAQIKRGDARSEAKQR